MLQVNNHNLNGFTVNRKAFVFTLFWNYNGY